MANLDVIFGPGMYLMLLGIKYWYLVLAIVSVVAATVVILRKKKKKLDKEEEQ